MSDPPIAARSADFHARLIAIAASGVPLEVAGATDAQQIRGRLDEIQREFERQVARGVSRQQLLLPSEKLSSRYLAAFDAFLEDPTSPRAFELLHSPAQPKADLQHEFRLAWANFAILALFLSLAIYSIFTESLPQFLSLYDSFEMDPGRLLRASSWLREHLLYWTVPLALLFCLLVWGVTRWRPGGSGRILSGLSAPDRMLIAAQRADLTKGMLHQLQTADSRSTRAGAGDDFADCAREAETSHGSAADAHESRAANCIAPDDLPPLLEWANRIDVDDTERRDLLENIEGIYCRAMEINREVFRDRLRRFLIAGVGGFLVLIAGILLFEPMAELLRVIAEEGNRIR
jgi:hypothetical protein